MALDWLNQLEFVDQTQVPASELPVSAELAMTGMPMRTSSGRVLVGFKAVRRALLKTPAGCLPALLAYLPGLNWVGARAYAWVALNRRRDAVCAVEGGGMDRDRVGGPVEGRARPADTAV